MTQWEIVGYVLGGFLIIGGLLFYLTKPLVFIFNRIENGTQETRVLIREVKDVVSELSSTVRILGVHSDLNKEVVQRALMRIDELEDMIKQIEINCAFQMRKNNVKNDKSL